MQSPYEAFPYSVDALCLHIENLTGTPYNQIRQKRQINYINNYLLNWETQKNQDKPSNLRVIVEHAYIDQHYLDDYSQYFIRCFKQYPRDCVRIHFFENQSIDSLKLRVILSSGLTEKRRKRLNKDYLGFVVIRPIPNTFIAKACLRSYEHLSNQTDSPLITRKCHANIYGIPLEVQSVAFQEQDRVLSACATSALWSFYHAHKCISSHNRPSAITITKSAYPEDSGMDAQFPNGGLTAEMMCRSIRAHGLEPRLFVRDIRHPQPHRNCPSILLRLTRYFRNASKHIFRPTIDIGYATIVEHIYAYCSGDQPLMMGIDVSTDGKKQGDHAVTVLGFGLNELPQHTNPTCRLKLKAHRITKLYIHDDRTGPYARLEFANNQWKLGIDNPIANDVEFKQESYKPTDLVLGLYHKIRIHYTRIRSTCASFVSQLIDISLDQSNLTQTYKDAFEQHVLSWEWDISISEVGPLKERILGLPVSIKNKELLLTRSLPKYIWSAKATDQQGVLFELLFDATDIPQGDVFLGAILHNSKVEPIFQSFANFCTHVRNTFVNKNEYEGVSNDHLWGMIVYYSHKASYAETLDGLFGMIKSPPYIKAHERTGDTIRDQEAHVFHGPDPLYPLEPDTKYIWTINQDGGLVIGKESGRKNDAFGGHPTLTRGAPSRIAGELNFKDNQWCIDSKSGRYSYNYTEEERMRYLVNVKSKRFEAYLGHCGEFAVEGNNHPTTTNTAV